MKYSEAPQLATNLIDAIEQQLDFERLSKTDNRPHVSDVLYCLRKAWRIRQIKAAGTNTIEREDEDQRLILLIGQALHTIVAKALGREANYRLESDWLVGEADARLIQCNCDEGVDWSVWGGQLCPKCGGNQYAEIEEFKTSRTGFALDDPEKYPHYIEQVASYMVLAKAMDTPTLKGVLHVLHLTFSGAPKYYEPHPKKLKRESDDEYQDRLVKLRTEKRAEYEQAVADWIADQGRHSNLRSWPLEFSQYEIDSWETELKRRASILLGPNEPSVDENVPAGKNGVSWTCTYCPFFVKKGGDCPGGIGRAASFFPIDRLDLI